METGLTPPQSIQPWGLIKKDNRANLAGCSAQWKLCVISNAVCVCVFTQTGSCMCQSGAASLSAGFFMQQTLIPIGLSQNTAHWCPLPDCMSQCPYAKLYVRMDHTVRTAGLNQLLPKPTSFFCFIWVLLTNPKTVKTLHKDKGYICIHWLVKNRKLSKSCIDCYLV